MTGRSMIPAPTGRDGGEGEGEKWEKEKDEDKNLQIVREQGKNGAVGCCFLELLDAS